MRSLYASELTRKIWNDFQIHFKSRTTQASYRSDLDELMEYVNKDFLEIGSAEVEQYFEWMEKRVEEQELKGATVAKKFRELHSFAQYVYDNREHYGVESNYTDEYEHYLGLLEKQEKFARFVPVEDIDRLFQAAKDDLMAYCIFTFLYRMGFSSTEIVELSVSDFCRYENGMYVEIKGRKELCYVPEDVEEVLKAYLKDRRENPRLFFNNRGNPLNVMYISRMMKKYTASAGIPAYSAQSIRNTCGFTLSSYGASPAQTAGQLGVTTTQIHRYDGKVYREYLQREVQKLVHVKILPPS